MNIRTFSTPNDIKDSNYNFRDTYMVVVDVLRSTSVIVTAIANGARGVVPARDIEDAMEYSRKLSSGTLLCGERNSLPIPGFALGNSPLEYGPDTVRGKTIILTTSNGTGAMLAADGAGEIAIGSLLNAKAVAKDAQASGRDVAILCSGTGGFFSLDDAYAAGAIAHELRGCAESVDDLSYLCMEVYQKYYTDVFRLLDHCRHVHILRSHEQGDDIEYCMQQDLFPIVPRYKDGMIKAENTITPK